MAQQKQGLIIDPTKSSKSVTSPGVSAPQLGMESLSSARQLSNEITDWGMAKQKAKDLQGQTFGLNYLATVNNKLSEFELEMATNKDIFKDPSKMAEIEQDFNERLETFKKTAQEMGVDSRFIDAYAGASMGKLQGAKNNFYLNYSNYQRGVAADRFLEGQIMEQQSNERYMAAGNYSAAVEGFNNQVEIIKTSVNSGIIDASKGLEMIQKNRVGIIGSYGISLINTPGAEERLKALQNINATQFFEMFKGYDIKVGDQEFKLGAAEFEAFKSGINNAMTELNRRNKANGEMSLLKEFEYNERRVNDTFALYAEINKLPAGYVLQEKDYVAMTNLKYGTDFKTLQEVIEKGFEIPYKGKGMPNLDDFYKDPNNTNEAVMYQSQIMGNRLVGGLSKEVQDDYYDSTNENTVLGSMGKDVYFSSPEMKYELDRMYTPANREALSQFSGSIEDTSISNSPRYAEPEYDAKYSSAMSIAAPFEITAMSKLEKKLPVPDVAVKFEALKYNGTLGDKKAGRFVKDFSRVRKDMILLEMANQTGGLITDDIADAINMDKKYIGTPISAQSPKVQQTIFDSFVEENPEIMKDIDQKSRAFINKATENYSVVDLGERGAIYVGKDVDINEAQKAVTTYLENNVLIDSNTGKRIGATKKIKTYNATGSNKIAFLYNGKPVLTSNMEYAVMEVGK